MGAWDLGPWDNDTSLDWGIELLDEMTPADLVRLLRRTADKGGYLDAEAGEIALAAASVMLAWHPRRPFELQEEVVGWLDESGWRPDEAALTTARAAIDRVMGPQSELAELWDQQGDAWRTFTRAWSSLLELRAMASAGWQLFGAGEE
jgi:hypothetical protein